MADRPTDEQLAEWLYDAEFDCAPVDADHDFDANPLPHNTFPPYYSTDYTETLAVLFRELLELRAAHARMTAAIANEPADRRQPMTELDVTE